MKILFDTSVLVPALIDVHPHHTRAHPWLDRARAREFEYFVAAHTLAEAYAVMSTYPVRPRMGPAALQMLRQNILDTAKVVALSATEYEAVLRSVADHGLTGGVVYDALIVKAAQKAGVDKILTFDVDDFRRVWPEGTDRIVAP